jgi:hypothetical protein
MLKIRIDAKNNRKGRDNYVRIYGQFDAPTAKHDGDGHLNVDRCHSRNRDVGSHTKKYKLQQTRRLKHETNDGRFDKRTGYGIKQKKRMFEKTGHTLFDPIIL